MIGAHANTLTGEHAGAALTHDDVARNGRLATEQLYTKTTAALAALVFAFAAGFAAGAASAL